jgi:hypothetical protein
MDSTKQISALYNIKDFFLPNYVGDELILIQLQNNVSDFNKYLNINALGGFIFEQIISGKSFDAIVFAILTNYEIDVAQASQDLSAFIDELYQYTIDHA